MRRERFNLEEQVGGLIDAGGRRSRRRGAPRHLVHDEVEPARYPLTKQGSVAIRAARAAGDPAHRQVA